MIDPAWNKYIEFIFNHIWSNRPGIIGKIINAHIDLVERMAKSNWWYGRAEDGHWQTMPPTGYYHAKMEGGIIRYEYISTLLPKGRSGHWDNCRLSNGVLRPTKESKWVDEQGWNPGHWEERATGVDKSNQRQSIHVWIDDINGNEYIAY